eukprot:9617035-Heterocapsa_arctica.AAC.1
MLLIFAEFQPKRQLFITNTCSAPVLGDIIHFTALAMDDIMCENAVARRHSSTYAYSKHMLREGCVACQAQLLCSTRTA